MNVYMINFPDNSIYIGATKGTIENRVSNHLSKCKSNKYNQRALYRKMHKFRYEFSHKLLKKCKTTEEMYETEIGYISLFSGESLLNNSRGGSNSSYGKTLTKQTYNRLIKARCKKQFKAYCFKTKKLLYIGSNMSDCAKKIGCSVGTISTALKNRENNVQKDKSRATRKRYIFTLTGGDLSQ